MFRAVLISIHWLAILLFAPIAKAELLYNCARETCHLQVLNAQDDLQPVSEGALRVTGTYSSGDVHGIEGMAIVDGEHVTERFQTWDGVLLVTDGTANIFQKTHVSHDNKRYDLTDEMERSQFIDMAKRSGLSVLQFHLVVKNGTLDIRPTGSTRRFVRRFLFTKGDEIGIYQTEAAETFYEGSVELLEKIEPDMALNLDMGAYDFCERNDGGEITECGTPFVSADKFTNFIELSEVES